MDDNLIIILRAWHQIACDLSQRHVAEGKENL